MTKRRFRFWIIVAVIAALASWSLLSGSDNSSSDELLLRGNSGEPSTLDPHLGRNSAELVIVNDLFVGLLSQDSSGKIIPGTAVSHTVSEDGRIWFFTLRDDLQWSDGKAMSSEDFVYSFRRVINPETAAPNASLLYPIKNARKINARELPLEQLGVTAPNDTTVKFELEQPTPYFDKILVNAVSLPVPRHAIEKYGKKWTRPPNSVSNGAFVVNHWSPRVYVEALRNEKFHDAGAVRLQGVRYIPTEDLSTQLKRFRAGELDIGLNFPPTQADWIKTNLKDEIRIFPIIGTYYYPINLRSPKLQNKAVRLALNMAVDRKVLTEKIMGSGELPAYSLVPPGFENYPAISPPEYTKLSMEERQKRAITLLASAGYDENNPLRFELRYNMTEEHQAIAVAVADMWRSIGVEASLLSTEARTHFKDLATGQYEIGRAALFAIYNDPKAFLISLSVHNKADNFTGYQNPAVDRLIRESDSILNPQERGLMMQQAERLALSDYPAIPLFHYVSKRLVSKRVRGWQNNPAGTHLSRYLYLGD